MEITHLFLYGITLLLKCASISAQLSSTQWTFDAIVCCQAGLEWMTYGLLKRYKFGTRYKFGVTPPLRQLDVNVGVGVCRNGRPSPISALSSFLSDSELSDTLLQPNIAPPSVNHSGAVSGSDSTVLAKGWPTQLATQVRFGSTLV